MVINSIDKIKNFTKGALITGLIAATLLASTGCESSGGITLPWQQKITPAENTISYPGTIGDYVHGSIPDVTVPGFTFERKLEDDLVNGLFPSPTLRTKEEIQETGITAQDVLDLYNDFCIQMLQYKFETSIDPERFTNGFSAEFGAILPSQEAQGSGLSFTAPFYYQTSDKTLFHHWFSNSDHSLYKPKYAYGRPTVSNVYKIQILCFRTAKGLIKNSIGACLETDYAVDADVFENMLKVFDIGTFILTRDKLAELQKEYPEYVNLSSLYLLNYDDHRDFLGEQEVYEPFCITKEVIEGANAAQLWALYDLVESLVSINFYGTNLTEQAE